jgi:acyl-CoA synthetase (AMP-forming)/AMP-acid ligase II
MAPEAPGRISDYPFHWARRDPGREAAVLGEARLTYGELAAAVERTARALHAAGIRRGDRVAMLSTPRPEYLVVFLATARLGALWLGLNPVHQPEEYRRILADFEPRILFGIERLRGRDNGALLGALAGELACVEALVTWGGSGAGTPFETFLEAGDSVAGAEFAAAVAAVEPGDVALIVYTSGTTGRSKGAMITHGNLVHCARLQDELFPVAPLRVLCNLPVSHVASSSDIVSHALVAGGAIIFQEKFDPAEALALIRRERVTCLLQASTMLQRMLALPGRAAGDWSSLKTVFFLGSPLPEKLVAELQALCPRVVTGWGLTEASCSVTYTDPADDVATLASTVGRPAPGYELRILDTAGRAAPPGEAGEVLVRGACVMAGYFRQPEASAAAIDAEGFLHTGDLGFIDADGRLRLVGRLKEMFKSGGYNIYPREIEAVLESYPGVAQAVVVAMPDPLYHEVGCAFLLRAPGRELSAGEVEAYCRARLANYKLPKRIIIRDSLPMLAIGKTDRAALALEARALAQAAGAA